MKRLRAALAAQAAHCEALGSPFTARLLTLVAARLHPGTPLADRLFDWPGDLTSAGDSVSLRLAGALHALKLQGYAPLVAVYPPEQADEDALWSAIRTALTERATFIDGWLDSPPQTNEVRRSAALIAVGHWLTARFGLPMVVSELGASAGLNLIWDRFALEIGGRRLGPPDSPLVLQPVWSGPLPPDARPEIAERRGVDLNPLDPGNADDRLRLNSYLWADQTHRMALTKTAMAMADAPVDRADAIDWLAGRLAPRPGQLRLIYSTVAWQYFPAAARETGTAMIETAGAQSDTGSPLAWFRMETDDTAPGAALSLRLWPGNHAIAMGRADFHGRWITWTAPDA